MKALVFGAGGQLGSDLVRLIPGAVGLSHAQLPVEDLSAVDAAVELHRPAVVFNCAAFNAVDRAESEVEPAFAVNSAGALNAAISCKRRGLALVHFSTNFVFDGTLDRPYVESDDPAPQSVYARSKLAGERAVLNEIPSALLIRTAALFGDRGSAVKGGSFPERMVERARKGERLRVVGDQRVNPTYTRDLAQATIQLVEDGVAGIVHLVADGCCSWAEFARAALEECGLDAEVEMVVTEARAAVAPRPLNGCLTSERVTALRPWREGLHDWASSRARLKASGG